MKQPRDFLPETETSVPIIRGAGEGKAVGVLRDRSLFKVLPEEFLPRRKSGVRPGRPYPLYQRRGQAVVPLVCE